MTVVINIHIPEVVIKRARELKINVEDMILELLLNEVKLDPSEEIGARLEIAERFLGEGKRLMNEDPVQASEKLYKAAEEVVKALALHFNLGDILEKVKYRGRWTVAEIVKAVGRISDRIGDWFLDAWDHAWALHVLGFHEGKLDSEEVRRRLPRIEKMVVEMREVVGIDTLRG